MLVNSSGNLIGTVGAEKISNTDIKLHTLYLAKEYRKKGLGKYLYNIFMDFAVNHNFKRIELNTYNKLLDAMSFYEKEGFKIYETEEDRIAYEKNI